jgi:hypothetical protein
MRYSTRSKLKNPVSHIVSMTFMRSGTHAIHLHGASKWSGGGFTIQSQTM